MIPQLRVQRIGTFGNYQRRNFTQLPKSRWRSRLAISHRRLWEKPTPFIPSTETYNIHRMRRERLIRVTPINPVWQSRRCPLMAYKVGSLNLWDEWGERHLVTLLKVDRLEVLEKLSIPKNGAEGMRYGLGARPFMQVCRAQIGESIKLKMDVKDKIESRQCSSDCILPVKHLFSVRHFTPGQWVMVGGFTKARGFQGVMKRWNMQGGPFRYGRGGGKLRSAGSTSARGDTLIRRGRKMPGHMGPDPRTVLAKVFRIESERQLIFVKGSLPSPVGQVVTLWDARGLGWQRNKDIAIHWPTFVPEVGVRYPVTQQCPPSELDPFLFTERPIYGRDR